MAIQASWVQLAKHDVLKRSSLGATAVGDSIYVFGGELRPRQPRDNAVHKFHFCAAKADDRSMATLPPPTGKAPSPRVGATMTALSGKIYMFSGRGGEAMHPVEEKGQLWVLEPRLNEWSILTPTSDEGPEARSYHSMTNDGQNTIYIHAGCPENGRLSDLWAFDLVTLEWRRLASAPDPPRGGTSIAFSGGKIYRMGGFDGKTEQGGTLDVYDPTADSWATLQFTADGRSGPGPRSVATLLALSIDGREHLITLFGESDPSSLGHQGAGKMLSDTWMFDIVGERWSPVSTSSASMPQGRGWFGADVGTLDGRDLVIVVGGLGESNERLDDAWLLEFDN